MIEEEPTLTREEFHKKMAVETNNSIWPVLDSENPTAAELEEALYSAYASRYHWAKVGTAVNAQRAEYMISRVYCVMGRGEPALFHARRCLEITEENTIGDFDLVFAYEVMARANAVAGNKEECKNHFERAEKALEDVKNTEDKKICEGELKQVTC
jgi:hypothetical protein